ncbi:hypothetical protein J6T93_02540 [bacterium]|nr:hypothetical protein [bacterium]
MRKTLAFLLMLLLIPPAIKAEETNDIEETAVVIEEPPKQVLTPRQQIIKYRDDVCSYYNMTNNLKEVIVIMHPILAEAEMAKLFAEELPSPKERTAFLKKWGARYKQILTNGFGFRLTFQLRNNFLDMQSEVKIPANIADYFTLLSSDGVRVKACRCVSDYKLPQTICFERPEVNVDLFFNTRDDSGKPLINNKTRAIRLQSSAVNSDFGSYNFSWWLPFKYPIKRPQSMEMICGTKPFRTFVSVHPEVYSKNIAYVNEARGAAEEKARQEAIAQATARERAYAAAKHEVREVPQEERSAFVKLTIAGALYYGLLAN